MSKLHYAASKLISSAVRQGALALLLVGPLVAGSPPKKHVLSPDEAAVLKPLQNLLDGISKRDKAEIRSQLLPGGMATIVRNGKIHQLSFEAFVERIPDGTEALEERIHDPQILIDDDIAVIWAPYEFLINGVVDHRGTDIVHLVRQDGNWLIAGLGDNGRKVESSEPAPK
jgi:hypothetical protein